MTFLAQVRPGQGGGGVPGRTLSPQKTARLKVPGLGEQMLLLMWPTDPQSAALLDKKLRRSGFASHADLARR